VRPCSSRTSLVLLIIVSVLLPALRPPPASAQQIVSGTISGSVVEETTGQPIEGATVRLAGREERTLTNRQGSFWLEGVPAGTHELILEVIGHEPRRIHGVSVAVGESLDLGVLALVVAPIVLDRVQVTATRDQRSIGEVAALITVVDRAQIERDGRVELTQALENVPGLVVSAQHHSFQSVTLRGMPRAGNEWTTTLLLIDGVPQTDSRNSARVINLPINDANSIEIARGPNSALYGRTAIGGVVNVMTRNPTPFSRAQLDMEMGGFGHLKGLGVLSGPLNDRSGYYLSASTSRNTGYFDQPFDFTIDQQALFGKLTFSPGTRTSGMVSANYVVSDNAVPTPIPVIDGQPLTVLEPSFTRFRNLNLPTANYHQKELRTTANLQVALGERVTFSDVIGFRRIQYRFDDDGDVIGAPFDLAARTFTQYPFELTTDEDIFFHDARLLILPRMGALENSLQIGFSVEHTDGYGAGNLIYTDEETLGWPLSFVDPRWPAPEDWRYWRFGGNDYRVTIAAGYANYSVEPLPWLILDAGARYDHAWMHNVQRFAAGEPEIRDGFSAFSPKLSATFRMLRDRPTGALGNVTLNTYATYSEAFLPPRSPSGLRPADEAIRLVPEDVANYEVGAKGAILGGQVTFEGAFFTMQRDGIVVSTREGPLFRPSNAGTQNYRGLETGLTWNPLPEISLYANGSFYRNRFGDFVIQRAAGDIDLSGNRLPIAPDRILNGGVAWQHRSGVGVSTNVKHMGDRYLDQGNTFLLDPVTLVDTAMSFRGDRVRVTLAAQNLFDAEYITMGDISNAQSINPAAPRQLRLTASMATR
jgi:outer membrane receptor protein involved in Fe transport